MLSRCPACRAEVSQRAAACPRCGDPLAPNAAPSYRPVWTVEATGKSWKKIQLVGGLLAVAGLVVAVVAIMRPDRPMPAIEDPILSTGALLTYGGLGALIVGRIGAWWNHG